MEFKQLLEKVGEEPIFESSLLLTGEANPAALHMQLSRWVKDGKIIQLRRGLYMLSSAYRKKEPHPFLIANRLQPASYVSLQSALAHYHLIPEAVMEITSITSVRPRTWQTDLGVYRFRKVKQDWFHSYRQIEISSGQLSYMALPEKALLDLIYLEPGSERTDYLQELRLQNTETLSTAELVKLRECAPNERVRLAIENLLDLLKLETGNYQSS